MINVELLIGPYEPREDAYEGNGFISAVYANFESDRAIVRERLKEERVPQMLCAAMEAMLRLRANARKMDGLDDWAAQQRSVDYSVDQGARAARTEAGGHRGRRSGRTRT
ncbi:hypothetical protein ACVWXM_002507 [Bradyrhizobium sp. GM7.3]